MPEAPRYRLLRPGVRQVTVPLLDEAQQRIVDHESGVLVVLAGPGTGKTTTLVEAAVSRVERGTPIEQILMLTFGRRAANTLRDSHATVVVRAGAGSDDP